VNHTNFSRFLHSTYTSPGKWQSKVRDPRLRAMMGLPELSKDPEMSPHADS
jgi:hypothetical protein